MNIHKGLVNTDEARKPALLNHSRLLATLANLLNHLKIEIYQNDGIYRQHANTAKLTNMPKC